MLTNLINFDYSITKVLSNLFPHIPFFNNFFSFFSLKGSLIFVWLLVMLIVLVLEERKNPGITKQDKKIIILFSLAFLITVLFTDVIFKNIFQRPRPLLSSNINYLASSTCPRDFSFPSTHAATAFASATILTFFDKKRRWFYYMVALLISYSRIYLGCHYFFDVVSGAIIGYLISRLFLFFPCTFPSHRKS